VTSGDLDAGWIRIDRFANATEAYVVFTHIGYSPGKFAQSKLLNGVEVDQIFVNTADNDWYQRGLPGVAPTIDQAIDRLAELLSSLGPRRVTCAGASMGAYASLLYGCRLGAQRVISVAPEIKIGEPWQRSISLNKARVFDPRHANLYDTIAAASGVEIYVAGYDLIDLGGFDARVLDHEGAKVTFLSGDHKVSERLDWRRLYAGASDLGVRRLPEPGKIHEYFEIKRAAHQGRSDDALQLLLSRCEWSGFAPDFYFAALEMTAKNVEAAIALLHRGLELDPHSVQSLHHLGLCLMARRRLDEAATRFRAALAINEAAPATQFRLAETLEMLGEREAASVHLKRALSLDRKNPVYQRLVERLGKKAPAPAP
jgi:tetratricopeptide (TPR) repeat protein